MASDPEDSTLSFAILAGNTDNAFSIDANSGAIQVNNTGARDFETTPSFARTVQVADPQGSLIRPPSRLTSTMTMKHHMTTSQSFTIDEDTTNGVQIGIVAASDPEIRH